MAMSSTITPVALLLPPTFNSMVAPTPLTSPAHQADWKARWAPQAYVPASLVADIALEDRRAAHFSPIPRHCIAVWCRPDGDESLRIIAHASGQSRDHVALTNTKVASDSNDFLSVEHVKVSTPIHQLAFSSSTSPTCLLAARSLSVIDILNISHDASASATKVALYRGKEIVDFAWSKYRRGGGGGGGCYLLRDGCLYHAADCTQAHPHSNPTLAWRPLPSNDPNDQNYGCCCAYTFLHPSQVAVALRRSLGTVDLRSPARSAFSPLLSSPPRGTRPFYTALSPAPPQCGGPYFMAAATATDILLFDIRKPQQPLRSWSTPTEWLRSSITSDLYHSLDSVLIDTLTWLSDGPTIVAASSWSGKAVSVACRNISTGDVGKQEICQISATPGRLQFGKDVFDHGHELSFTSPLVFASSSSSAAGAGAGARAGENAAITSVWDAELSVPRAFMSCVREAKAIQYKRKCRREMELQVHRRSSIPEPWKPVLLRPSKRCKDPFSLGLAVTEDSTIYVLSPTQEVIIGSLHLRSGGDETNAWPVWLAARECPADSGKNGGYRYMKLASENTIYDKDKVTYDIKGDQRLIVGVDVQPEFHTEDPILVDYPYHEKLMEVAVREYREITDNVPCSTTSSSSAHFSKTREERLLSFDIQVDLGTEKQLETETGTGEEATKERRGKRKGKRNRREECEYTQGQQSLTYPKFNALLQRAGIQWTPNGPNEIQTSKNNLFRIVEEDSKKIEEYTTTKLSIQIPQSLEGQETSVIVMQRLRNEWKMRQNNFSS